VNAEVPSPFAGTLTAILAEEGATVPNEAPIAEIEADGAAAADVPADAAEVPAGSVEAASAPAQTTDLAPAAAASAEAPPAVGIELAAPQATGGAAPAAPPPGAPAPAVGDADARMTPAVRRLLREHDLAPEQVRGTGAGGRITRDDVLAVVEAQRTGGAAQLPAASAPAPAPAVPAAPAPAAPAAPAAGTQVAFPPGADEVLVPMTQMRKGIAAQMTRALQVPHAYVHVEVDATNLVRLRESAKRDYQAR